MGCWNGTCGISNIHIMGGEEVYVVPLVKLDRGSMCYTTPFFTPTPFLFEGIYNDYGAAEDCKGYGLSIILEAIKKNLHEVEPGENEYHDIAVKAENFNIDLFWEAIHEQRLAISCNYYKEGPFEVGMTMIKKSVADHIFDNWELSHYDYDTSTYIKYKFADIVASLDEAIEKMLAICAESSIRRFMPLDSLFGSDYRSPNHALRWLQSLGHSHMHSPLQLDYRGTLNDLIEAEDRHGLRELFIELLKVQLLDRFLMDTRKIWTPQGGAGSQSASHGAYRVLISAMTSVLDEEHARRTAEDYEDGDYE